MISPKKYQNIILVALLLTLVGLGMVLAGFISEVFFGVKMAGVLGAVLVGLPALVLVCTVVVVVIVTLLVADTRLRLKLVSPFDPRWFSRRPDSDSPPPRRRPRR
ncbi:MULTISPECIES: hypothetical protein [Xanthomonas]|uniref:Uncharacterized protein n=3 Tax=Xanthomonas TaxID=338 RepID=A0AA44YZ73_XANCM|nr:MULTISPECIES: hypothetical protein [Xanthomonas]AOL20354.1 hypothetical protein BGK55_15235 [Xanthomonas citri pv. malvacearum]AOY68844.1 hypothetical protein BHE83_21450 [Xanthomonas euvesicatoria pv. vesicatoria str. 85-10]ASN02246.1 hypothetical protein APY29_15930 [Xanthomonas citri pv. malvacearum]ASY85436.1 hypothetical protein CIW71_17020 [Xanthomonas citri pv. malvacearum]ASY89641.1 hypothetical protein CIW72_15980 [Xanthomonas citri pv. malvacearum]